jgi:hypothetical protein|tara:strand:- start:255 stop:509 length:255 start_codon:yes stop_codon:yes gene_type:complete
MIHESEISAIDSMWGFKAQMEEMMGSKVLPVGRAKYGERLVGDKRVEVALQCKDLHETGMAYIDIGKKFNVSAETAKRLIEEAK